MPTIAVFHGIVIYMYWAEHGVPHLHAMFGEEETVFSIETCKVIVGKQGRRRRKLASEWIAPAPDGACGELAAGPSWATFRTRSRTGK